MHYYYHNCYLEDKIKELLCYFLYYSQVVGTFYYQNINVDKEKI